MAFRRCPVLSRCEKCGFEAATEFLTSGLCGPCRDWKWGPTESKYNKGTAPPPPKVTRTITVRRALARARNVYGYVPKFVVNIIRLNTRNSGSMESFPMTKLPGKLHDEKVRRLLRLAENKRQSSSRTQAGSKPAP